MNKLTLEKSLKIIEGAFKHAAEIGCKPLTIAVLDEGGHLKAFQKQDGSSLIREEIARGKAWGALGMGMNSRELNEIADKRPAFIQSIVTASGGKIVPAPGGVLIKSELGEILGAVGATGDTSDKDEACVIAGIKDAGFFV